ncbi:MarR family winged helix-turn-helix transcriptional regulator [Algivirga pacifica]|uniref:HTH marR-type domain-containing protein n=1 Tax=Algivirga pacifica TaxID=1162670 RepID=A0ABP9D936_9BACT
MMTKIDKAEKRRQSIDFRIKGAWLAISKMYNVLGTDFDITHSTGFVLLNIDVEEGTPATKIAPLMGMEARSLTRMLKTMEEQGVIERVADENDRRKVIIKLTEKGKVKREMSKQTVKVFQGRVRNIVSEEDMETFFKVLDSVHNVIQDPEHGMLDEIKERLAEKGITEDKVIPPNQRKPL